MLQNKFEIKTNILYSHMIYRTILGIVILFLLFACKQKQDGEKSPVLTHDTTHIWKLDTVTITDATIVTAQNGLVIREQPDLSGKKIGKLDYLSTVQTGKTTDTALEIKDEGKTIKGHWVEILENNAVKGYAFDGFLASRASFFSQKKNSSFRTAQVSIATKLMPTRPAADVFRLKTKKETYFIPEDSKKLQLIYSNNNNLIQAVQDAYDTHRPLILSPDIIWLSITQGFSIHINQNFKTLEGKIFKKDKPSKIEFRIDELNQGAAQWAKLVSLLSKDTQKYTHDNLYQIMVPKFSTTTPLHTTAYQVTLLEGFEQAFQYVAESGCGIPYITIEGTPEDWKKIYENTQKLKGYGVDDWLDSLEPVLQQFYKASLGHIDQPFWNDIYKNASEYAAFYISGWIIKFFPYLKATGEATGEYDNEKGSKVKEIYIKNPYYKNTDYLMSTLSTDDFPSGLAEISIQWNNRFNNSQTDIQVFAGFMGIQQFKDKSLKPYISYAICKKEANQVTIQEGDFVENTPNECDKYWIPYPIESKSIKQAAIYNHKKYKDTAASYADVKSYLKEQLKLPKKKLSFIVLTNGKVTNVTLDEAQDILSDEVQNLLNQMPSTWLPALAPIQVIDKEFEPHIDDEQLMKVNSYVRIQL